MKESMLVLIRESKGRLSFLERPVLAIRNYVQVSFNLGSGEEVCTSSHRWLIGTLIFDYDASTQLTILLVACWHFFCPLKGLVKVVLLCAYRFFCRSLAENCLHIGADRFHFTGIILKVVVSLLLCLFLNCQIFLFLFE